VRFGTFEPHPDQNIIQRFTKEKEQNFKHQLNLLQDFIGDPISVKPGEQINQK
jgi:hypothetical protein